MDTSVNITFYSVNESRSDLHQNNNLAKRKNSDENESLIVVLD